MNKLTSYTHIKNGSMVYDKNFKAQFDEFKKANEDRQIAVTYELDDTPEHAQYKYYFGHLLPDLADAMGVDKHYCHIFCKRDKLLIPVTDYNQIKKKHLSTGIFMISQRELADLPDYLPYSMIRGALIVYNELDGEKVLTGYIPSVSMKSFNYSEMDAYIKAVEKIFTRDLQGTFKDHSTAMDLRQRAFGTVQEASDEERFENQIEWPV